MTKISPIIKLLCLKDCLVALAKLILAYYSGIVFSLNFVIVDLGIYLLRLRILNMIWKRKRKKDETFKSRNCK